MSEKKDIAMMMCSPMKKKVSHYGPSGFEIDNSLETSKASFRKQEIFPFYIFL
jgi:hypothetical protein